MHLKWLPCGAAVLAVLAADPPADPPKKLDADGVPNLIRLNDRIYQGGMPQGDAGFASLEKLGVKTVISVDGARPDLEDAHKHGIRYVHLPMGYDGMTREQALKVARAVRDLPGPVYIHCHKGTQRGPTAAAVARLFLDDGCSVEQALEGMKLAGFEPRYTGLWAAPKDLKRPTAKEIDEVAADFPEAAPPPGLTAMMVQVNDAFENIQAIRKAEWKTPKDRPDLDPPHEALLLEEHFKELQRSPKTADRPDDFRARLVDAEADALALEAALRVAKDGTVDAPKVEDAYKRMDAACLKCHAIYRDVPHP
ncbi:MAG TPA: hypothetical protein VMS17_21015 [Gemmataceae bacterium]|nr:hypothetical protein [Gemmataceae bacterium]